MTDTSTFDPNVIIKAADDKLANNDLEGGQMLFQSALLGWVDDAREKMASSGTTGGEDTEQMREAIATLWIAYAHYLRKAKQFKSATEAYEQAVQCPVSGNVGRIWLDFARFAEERGKLRTAQQVYIRALVGEGGVGDVDKDGGGAVKDEQDRSLLWNEFLEMMRQSNPSLTMKALREAIDEEQAQQAGGDVASSSRATNSIDALGVSPEQVASNVPGVPQEVQPPSKRPRLEQHQQEDTPMEDNLAAAEQQRSHVLTAAEINQEHMALEELTRSAQQDPDFMAAWMLRDGDAPPQPPEPPLFAAAPPKLSDPTAKDILGEDLALSLIQRLQQPSGTILLEVCRALWMLTALKEQQSHKALTKLDATVRNELEKMNSKLDERLSVAGAAEAAVRLMNETERSSFQMSCNQQRQHVLNGIAWEFRQLLWVQQQLLTKLQVPGFDGTTVDAAALDFQARVCSYLHSAFYLRKRIGETKHQNMLKSHLKQLQQQQQKQTNAGNAGKKPSRFSPLPPTAGRYSPQPPAGRFSPHPPSMMAAGTKSPQRQPYGGRSFSPVPPPQQQRLPAQHYMGQPQPGYNLPPGYPGQPQQLQPHMHHPNFQQQQQPPHQQQNFY